MKKRLFMLLMVTVILISGCDDIFVRDISNDSVKILCPTDGYKGNSTDDVLFWWEGLDGAESYSIQIVSPGFDSIRYLFLDKQLDTTKYSVSLPEGEYQWRIKAMNSYYSSKWATCNLHIGETIK